MKTNTLKTVLVSVVTFICGGLLMFGALWLFKDKIFTIKTSSNGACYTACTNKVTINETGLSDSVDKIYEAVYLVNNYKNNKIQSSGTGFVYKVDNKNGYLLTNYHVINGNTSLKVVNTEGAVIDAKYVGGDEYLDIAVLTIPKDEVTKVAEIGTSKNTKLGDTVFTIGTPVDQEYQNTVTRGILSGKDRLVSATNDTTNETYITRVLQTDAAMNPGNSGGPLCNGN